MFYEVPTELTTNFFSLLEDYIKCRRHTGILAFDKYSNTLFKFTKSKMEIELQKSESQLKSYSNQLVLLNNHDMYYRHYEALAKEKNALYIPKEEFEKNVNIYNFLNRYSNRAARKDKINEIKEKSSALNEYREAINLALTNNVCKQKLNDLRTAESYWPTLSRIFFHFICAHPEHEFVKKYNVTQKNYDRFFFDKHCAEIYAIKNDKSQEK